MRRRAATPERSVPTPPRCRICGGQAARIHLGRDSDGRPPRLLEDHRRCARLRPRAFSGSRPRRPRGAAPVLPGPGCLSGGSARTCRPSSGRGARLAILSNGTRDMLAAAVASAGIGKHLDAVLSIDEVGVFKTDPRGLSAGGRPVAGIAGRGVVPVFEPVGRRRRSGLRLPLGLGQSGGVAGRIPRPPAGGRDRGPRRTDRP